jgi:hypothetical protein
MHCSRKFVDRTSRDRENSTNVEPIDTDGSHDEHYKFQSARRRARTLESDLSKTHVDIHSSKESEANRLRHSRGTAGSPGRKQMIAYAAMQQRDRAKRLVHSYKERCTEASNHDEVELVRLYTQPSTSA